MKDNEFESPSLVTPDKKQSFFQSTVFQAIAALCLLFLVVGFFNGSKAGTTDRDESQNETGAHNTTLNDNLARLSALKQKELEQQKQLEEEKLRALLHKQQNRLTPATADGELIGNPRTYRTSPQKAKLSQDDMERISAGTTFLNVSHTNNDGSPAVTNQRTTGKPMFNQSVDNGNASVGYVKASKMAHPEYTLAAGEVIHATLETAINSQLQGPVRAITTRDIYSLDASNQLIPKGSILMGQYQNAGITQTQNRVLIAWQRVQLPNGITANLNSPSTDKLGRAGTMADSIDHHFIERFGSSVLFSILGAYTANTGVNGADRFNSASQYRMSLAQSFQKTSSDYLNQRNNLPPTLSTHQGAEIDVFVDKDVSFYDVLRQEAIS